MRILAPILIFVAIMLLRFSLNMYKLHRVRLLKKKYEEYLLHESWEMAENTPEIEQLFKDAGVSDSAVSHQEFLGYGQFANRSVRVFDNMLNNRSDIVALTTKAFHEAIGVYRKRAWETLNPFYWIEFIFKLPQHLLGFFGVLPENIAVKILLVIYWLVVVLLGLQKFDLIKILSK
jgi:hypothetical protein